MIVRQDNFQGGISDSPTLGVKGSFDDAVGCDIHSEPGVLKVNQKLTVATPGTDFVKCKIQGTDGSTYLFGDAGTITKRTSAGVYSLVYTDTGADAILGAAEYDGYLYWATHDKLHRKPFPGQADWSDVVEDWATFGNGDTAYHPMIVNGLYLFIGDGRGIASVDDAGTFTANGTPDVTFTSLPHGYRMRCFYNYDIDLLIGTWVAATINKARVFRWTTVDVSYESSDDINEVGVNAFIPFDNSVIAQCGKFGNFYFYDGKNLREPPAKRIRGTYTPSKYLEVYPNAVSNLKGLPLFGVSNGAGNPCKQGVYSLGRYDKNYPLALNLEFVPSPDKTTGIEIGVLHSIGSDLLVSWKNNNTSPATYGIDELDYTAKYASAYLTTRVLGKDRVVPKSFKKYWVSYKSSPASTNIALSYIKNYQTTPTTLTTRDKSDEQQAEAHLQLDTGSLQLRLDFTVSGNDAPEIEEVAALYTKKGL